MTVAAIAKNGFAVDPAREHRVYPIVVFRNKDKRTTITAISYYDEKGVNELRKVETIDKDGKVTDTKESFKFIPRVRIFTQILNGAEVHGITGGGATWHSKI